MWCLPDTGAPFVGALLVIAALLVAGGVVFFLVGRSRKAAFFAALLIALGAFFSLAVMGTANAQSECPPGTTPVRTTPPNTSTGPATTANPTTTTTVDPTSTTTVSPTTTTTAGPTSTTTTTATTTTTTTPTTTTPTTTTPTTTAPANQTFTIAKVPTFTDASPGGVVTYTITVTNTGTVDIVGLNIVDDLTGVEDDATVTLGTVPAGTAYTSPNLTWTGDLAAGATQTFTYQAAINDPASGDGTLRNSVTSPTPGGPANPVVTDTLVQADPVQAFTLQKTVSASQAAPGDVVTYTLRVTNSGTVAITGLVAVDDLTGVLDDATVGNASADVGSASVSGSSLTWTGDLAAGASAVITYDATVEDPVDGDSQLVNSVSSTTTGGPASPVTTTTPIVTPPAQSFTLEKTASVTSAAPGGVVTYTLTVTNTGTQAITGLVVTDDLSGVEDDAVVANETAGSGTVAVGPGLLTWTGDLAAGASVVITYDATVEDPVDGDAALINSVSSPTAGGPTAPVVTNTPIDVPPTQAFTLEKQASVSESAPGDVVTYTLRVTNTGTVAITGLVAVDDLTGVLDDATVGNVSADTGSASVTGSTLTWTGDLAPGASAVITYDATVEDPVDGDSQLVNSVSSTTTGGPASPVTTTTPIVTPPAQSFTLEKTASVTSAAPGGVVTYTLTVTNTGTQAITGLNVADDLTGVLDDATVGNASADVGSALVTGSTLTWTGDLAPGASAVITYDATVEDPVDGDSQLVNSVSSTTTGGPASPVTTTTPISSTTFSISSDAWDDATITDPYVCSGPLDPGGGTSPPISWANAPAGTVAFAITIIDTTASNFNHWTVINIPSTTTSLAEGASGTIQSPASELMNDFNETGYGGPCPPPNGVPHNYVLTVYALNATVADAAGIQAATIASASLTSQYTGHF